MVRGVSRFILHSALVVLTAATIAYAQGATSSISGVVVDSAGGVVPGATVVVTNAAGTKFETVTNPEGIFNVPAVSAGAYSVDVWLSGFKT